jgi:glycosyltransferase involved in cell wall biosynthesis
MVANPGGDRLPGALTQKEVAARARAPGPLRLIFVGNLTPRKELHTLLAALAALPRENWRLAVAGSLAVDPAYTRAIRGQMARAGLGSRVALLGPLADAELAAHLAASHLLAVPSSYEGFGIVYLEAMRLGLPAIAGSNGAAREIITPGRDGFLVPPGDAAALARRLAPLARDRESLARMSLAAWERSRSHPTWEAGGALVRRFLHGLAEGRRESGPGPVGPRMASVIDSMEKGADDGRPQPPGRPQLHPLPGRQEGP